LDKASIFGVVVGIGLVVAAILLGGSLITFVNLPGVLVVGGGTFAATSIAFPTNELKWIWPVSRRVFNNPSTELVSIAQFIVRSTVAYKKDGALALEPLAEKAPTKPLGRGLLLIADGAKMHTLQSILAMEKKNMEEHHRAGQKIFTEMGKYAPAFGMVGTLIGLVQMLANMSDPDSIGPSMAVALLTTFYGALLANLIFLPMVAKLDRRRQAEAIQIELVMVGLESLLTGDTGAILKEKLKAYLLEQAVDVDEALKGGGE